MHMYDCNTKISYGQTLTVIRSRLDGIIEYCARIHIHTIKPKRRMDENPAADARCVSAAGVSGRLDNRCNMDLSHRNRG